MREKIWATMCLIPGLYNGFWINRLFLCVRSTIIVVLEVDFEDRLASLTHQVCARIFARMLDLAAFIQYRSLCEITSHCKLMSHVEIYTANKNTLEPLSSATSKEYNTTSVSHCLFQAIVAFNHITLPRG